MYQYRTNKTETKQNMQKLDSRHKKYIQIYSKFSSDYKNTLNIISN